jgi:putative oxygen-independent coproporphyrinogen III oxidase
VTAAQEGTLAVYVHWPFCRSKCPYCDFNSHVAAGIDQARWRRALIRELDDLADRLGARTVASVFFGGGTPSLMPPATAAAVIARIGARFALAADAEITLEANPTSVEAARLTDFAHAGINRISLGVQALDESALRFLGRAHGVGEALAAVEAARAAVPRISFDLIYGRPGQTPAAWRAELTRALAHAGGHLSAYQLTIEKGTPFFAAYRGGAFAMPDEDSAAALYAVTQEVLERAGLPAYEISNHARAGEACRHNLAYWRHRDYAGIGPGAHGRLALSGEVLATEAIPAPDAWLAAVEAQGHGRRRTAPLSRTDLVAEVLLMGLRLGCGVAEADLVRRTGLGFADALDAAALPALTRAGLIELQPGRIVASARGRLVLDGIVARLAPQNVGEPKAAGAGSITSKARAATR